MIKNKSVMLPSRSLSLPFCGNWGMGTYRLERASIEEDDIKDVTRPIKNN